ncbi:MAG: hypothetical protein V1897_03415, partial [Pseudomonadota bacterium]
TILYALDKYHKETDYRELLLRLIAQGRLASCAEAAMAIALDGKEEEEIRHYAIDAVSAACTDFQLRKVTEYAVKQAKQIPPRLLGTFCEELFPQAMSVRHLLTVLRSVVQIIPNDYRGMPGVLSRIAEKTCPPDKLLFLINELLTLIKKKPFLKEHEISKRYAWLVQPIAKAITRILKEFPTEQIPFAVVIDALSMIKIGKRFHDDYHEDHGELKTAISKHPPLVREIFWETVRKKRIPKGGISPPVVNQLYQIHHSETLWDLSATDLEWLLDDLANRGELDDRLLALHSIFHVLFFTDRRDETVPSIRAAVSGNIELENQLNEYVKPRSKRENAFERKHRADELKRRREEEKRHQKNKEVLLQEINAIREGKNFSALHFLRYEMRDKGSGNSWGQASWRSLIPKYGNEVAEAARSGFKRMWRDWSPPLPHETSSRKEFENGIPVGLTGLALDAIDGLDFRSLSTDELNKAARYAMRELNGFPDWLSKLADIFPEAVRSTIAACVTADYAIAADQECPHDVLAKLVYAPEGLVNLCAPDLFDLFKKGNPPNTGNLDYTLRILLKSSAINSNELARIAARRARSAITERRVFLPMFETWLITSGEASVIFLERHLSSLPSRDADELMLHLCSALVSRHGFATEADKKYYENVPTLKRFIPLIYEHIRPIDDTIHNGPYSLDERDHAEEFRSKISTKLSEISGMDTYKALLSLAKDKRISTHTDYFLMLARRRAVLDAEFTDWQPEDVNRFGIHFGVEPKTSEDLFKMALDRLDDIRNHIEKSDFSTRGLFRSDTSEEEMQKWFADRLQLTSRYYYTVHREEEVDSRKKPDIRLSHPNTEGPVGIEVKCADSWAYRELEDALKLQLADQYLRDIKSRHGILLLAYIGCKKRWKTLDGKGWLKFQDIVASLEKEAYAFARNNGDISRLKVVAIDFSPA